MPPQEKKNELLENAYKKMFQYVDKEKFDYIVVGGSSAQTHIKEFRKYWMKHTKKPYPKFITIASLFKNDKSGRPKPTTEYRKKSKKIKLSNLHTEKTSKMSSENIANILKYRHPKFSKDLKSKILIFEEQAISSLSIQTINKTLIRMGFKNSNISKGVLVNRTQSENFDFQAIKDRGTSNKLKQILRYGSRREFVEKLLTLRRNEEKQRKAAKLKEKLKKPNQIHKKMK